MKALFIAIVVIFFINPINAADTKLSDKALAACVAGELQVCADISNAYRSGQRDENKVFEYAKKACQGNATFTCYDLAMAYRKGSGTDMDSKKAYKLLSNICVAKAETEKEVRIRKNSCRSAEKLAKIYPEWQAARSEVATSKNAEKELKRYSPDHHNANIFMQVTHACNASGEVGLREMSPDIMLRFFEYGRDRNVVYQYPSNLEQWHVLSAPSWTTNTSTIRLPCQSGLQVCYTAYSGEGSVKTLTWGGLNADGTGTCEKCCYTCPIGNKEKKIRLGC